ncbi:hypothetical protein D3C84_611370 [compost metagenome]
MSQGEGVSANIVGRRQAECLVVQLVAVIGGIQGSAVALGVIEVDIEHQALVIIDWQRPVDVGVVLAPVIFNFGVVEAGAQVVGEGVATTENVGTGQARALDACLAILATDTVVIRLRLSVERGEVTGVQLQTVDFLAGEQEAFNGFWQQAAVVGGQNRQGGELGAVLEDGVRDAHFDCAAAFRERIFGATVRSGRELTGTGTALAAVQFDPEHADGVNTEAYSALGKAGLVGAEKAQAGFFGASWATICRSRAVAWVTAEIQHAGFDVQRAVFNKALGFTLRRGECHLRGACCNSQGDYAPLHHAHRDLLLWFLGRVLPSPIDFFMWRGSFFLCRRKCISRRL